MEKVLPMDGEYIVPVGVNEEGEADALAVNEHPQLGRTARLFSNVEEFDKYLEEVHGVELGHYRRMSVGELAPFLEAQEVPQVVIDRGSDGWWGRYYLSPHRA
jgi:hypothetical protein